VMFRDNWASPEGLLIAAEMWRELFGALSRVLRILHAHDKFVFFQSDGKTSPTSWRPDQGGIDAIHSQFSLMDFERLANGIRTRHLLGRRRPAAAPRARVASTEFASRFWRFARRWTRRRRRESPNASGTPASACRRSPTFFEQWLIPLPMHA